jgi:hypothetical protein
MIIERDSEEAHSSLSALGSLCGAWKSYLFSPARLLWVKTRFQIRPDRIFGRGGRMLVATLGDAGKGWGKGSSVGAMVKARKLGWREYRHWQGGRV